MVEGTTRKDLPAKLRQILKRKGRPTTQEAADKVSHDFSAQTEGMKTGAAKRFSKGVEWAESKLTAEGRVLRVGEDGIDAMLKGVKKKQAERLNPLKEETRQKMVWLWADQVDDFKKMIVYIDKWDELAASPVKMLEEMKDLGNLAPKNVEPLRKLVETYKEQALRVPVDPFWEGVEEMAKRIRTSLRRLAG